MAASAPATVEGVRTLVIPTNAHAVAAGSAPLTPLEANLASAQTLPAAVLSQAVCRQAEAGAHLIQQNPAFFGVGVGQSLDNPKDAALVIYVDRKKVPAQLPATIMASAPATFSWTDCT